MANNKNNPPVEGDGLLSYLNNELGKADKYKLEEQMLEDEFLADAAEGLGMVKDKTVLAANIAAINAGINSSLGKSGAAASQTGRSVLSVVGNTVAVAATIALLVVAAYFISQYSSENKASKVLAENKSNVAPSDHLQPAAPLSDGSVVPAEELPTDTIRVTEPEGTFKGLTVPSKAYKQHTSHEADEDAPVINYGFGDKSVDVVSEGNVSQTTTPDVYIDLNKYGPASNNNYNISRNNDYGIVPPVGLSKEKTKVADKKANKYRAEEPPADDAPGVYMDGILIKKDDSDKTGYNANPTRSTVTGTKDSHSNDILGKGMNYYKNGDYRSALGEFETFLKNDAGNVKALYYSAMANKYLGRENKALEFYSKVPAGNSYYENAQWEKAQIYKSQKKNAQTITALKEVVSLNGPLKIRAEKMLKDMGQ